MRAVDQDEGIDDAILYTISSGNLLINGTPSFAINESTGVISVNVPTLDREEHPTYTLTVTVSIYPLPRPGQLWGEVQVHGM